MADQFLDETNFYTRNEYGVCTFFATAEEAMNDFLTNIGYRVSIETDEYSIHFYREPLPVLKEQTPGTIGYIDPSYMNEYEAKILVIRKNRYDD